MSTKQIKKLIAKFEGWTEPTTEGFIARFPSPWHKEQFQRALDQVEATQ